MRGAHDSSMPLYPKLLLPQFHNAVLGHDAANVSERINQRTAANQRSWTDHGITSDLYKITDDRAEFSETGRNEFGFGFYCDFFRSNRKFDNITPAPMCAL